MRNFKSLTVDSKISFLNFNFWEFSQDCNGSFQVSEISCVTIDHIRPLWNLMIPSLNGVREIKKRGSYFYALAACVLSPVLRFSAFDPPAWTSGTPVFFSVFFLRNWMSNFYLDVFFLVRTELFFIRARLFMKIKENYSIQVLLEMLK